MALAALPAPVKAAAGAALVAGLFGVVDVLQLFGIIRHIDGIFGALPALMGIESLAALAAAFVLYRVRPWAPWLGMASGALLWMTSSAWFLFAAANGVVTLFGLLLPFLGLAVMVLTLVSRKACQVTAQARERLAAQGLELGV
jgi:hypothetical protein